MNKVPEIVFPPGTRSVPVSEIPPLIARALYPELSDSRPVVKCLVKVLGKSPTQHTPPCQGDDLTLVAEIAGPPPPAGQSIPREQLDAYLTTFNTSPRRPDWELGASVVDEALNANILRLAAEDDHRTALKKAIRAGSFVPLSHALLPLDQSIREALDLGQVFVETFRDYASKFNVLVRVERTLEPESISIETAAHWLAGQTADERASRWFKEGRNNDVRGDIAAAMTEADIVSHALALAAEGKIHPTNPVTGLPGRGTFTPDKYWELTERDADLLAAFVRPIAVRKRIEADQDAARRSEGRYTLRDAADAISAGTGERQKEILARVVSAARNNKLPMYEPGSNLRLRYAEPFRASAVRDFYDEARWDELNAWLNAYEPHITWCFPDPKSASRKSPPDTADAASGQRDWRLQARDIANALFDHDTSQQTRDSLEGYSRRVMTKMQEREIHGPRGRITNHKTVMREALQGKHWWAGKSR